jgi:hypothetical protein
MPDFTFPCQACGAELTAPADETGGKAKCRQCGSAVTIPAPTPDDEPTGQDEPRPRSRTNTRAGLRKVSLGLLVLLLATVAGILFTLAFCLWNFVPSFSPDPTLDGAKLSAALESLHASQIRVLLISLGVHGLQDVATLAGYALCCFVPSRYGRKHLAVAALVLGGIGLAVHTAMELVQLHWMRNTLLVSLTEQNADLAKVQELSRRKAAEKDPAKLREIQQDVDKAQREQQQHSEKLVRDMQRLAEDAQWQSRIAVFGGQLRMLLHAAQYLAFAFFLMGLARSLGASGTATDCLNLIKLTAVLLLVQVLTGSCIGLGLTPFAMRLGAIHFFLSFAMFVGSVVGLLALAQTIWFLLIMYKVRGAVKERASRRTRRTESA